MSGVITLEKPSSPPNSGGERLRFWTADEIAKASPVQWIWIARPWAAVGAVTEVDGKPKSAGKTTFGLYLTRAVLDGTDFLGDPTLKCPVVYLTEQSRRTFAPALNKVGLLGRTDLSVLFWPEARGAKWPEIVKAARVECKRIGAKLLIVDTLARFAGMAGDTENSAGDALEVMGLLRIAAERRKLAVVVMRHERKSGGDVGDSGRGSSAFAGEVDTVISIRRPDGKQRDTIRFIKGISRDDGEFERTIELTATGYVSHGTTKAVVASQTKDAILGAVPKKMARAVKTQQLLEKAGLRDNTTARKAIAELVEEKRLHRMGSGKRGAAYRYWAAALADSNTGD